MNNISSEDEGCKHSILYLTKRHFGKFRTYQALTDKELIIILELRWHRGYTSLYL